MSRRRASRGRGHGWVAPMVLYLLGIFMGAIDTGIVTPGRTVIQTDLGVDDQTGIWMITIYTLSYAAAIPIMGKLADRVGRKPIYLTSIALFGLGSLACGLSQDVGSFGMLITARAVQAVGGGGILPIATAEIGTTVPGERRGMALGLVGAVYGIANIFGASAGSLILDVAGTHNWQWIFYVNVPIAAVIVVAGLIVLPNRRGDRVAPLDIIGSLLLVVMVLALLYGIGNIDFFNLGSSLASTDVWPYLLAFVVTVPVFVFAERHAADPVLNLRYFTDFSRAGVLLLSLLSGVSLMAVVFVPQFAENALRIPTGSGGYAVIALGLASGIAAPLSGTLTDRFGPKMVLGAGAVVALAATACIEWWAIPYPSPASVFTVLGLFGLSLGFVIGSPLNYMMLERVPESESNSALGTSSLMRSIGTTLAPAIMVGFLAHAGGLVQDRLVAELPTSIPAPQLPYASELSKKFAEMKADPELAKELGDVTFPDLDAQTIQIDVGGGDGTLPPDLVELLKTADVTTIVDRTKTVATRMFDEQTPSAIADITSGVNEGIKGLNSAISTMDDSIDEMTTSLATMDDSLASMATSLDDMDAQLAKLRAESAQLQRGIVGLDQASSGVNQGIAGVRKAIAGASAGIAGMDAALAKQQDALEAVEAQLDQAIAAGTPASELAPLEQQIAGLEKSIAALEAERDDAVAQRKTLRQKLDTLSAQRSKLATQRAQLVKAHAGVQSGISGVTQARAKLSKARADLATARKKLASARTELRSARSDLVETRREMGVLRDAVPGAFQQSLQTYLAEIDARGPVLEDTFATTIGGGFRGVYAVYGAAAALMLVLLPLIPPGRRDDEGSGAAEDAADPAEATEADGGG